MPGSHGKNTLPTGSIISVRDLCDLVNRRKRTESPLKFRQTETGVNRGLCSKKVYYQQRLLSMDGVDNTFEYT